MKEFFNSTIWNTFVLIILGVLAIFTKEIVTFIMLGFILIMLSNIYDKLDDIFQQGGGK
jgi:hypothetical protein